MSNILIVDDEPKMCHLLSIMLERRGHKTDMAGDGAEAFEKIQANHYNMVITDIKMPRMDGITLLQKIKERRIPCPVVFITAFATVDSAVDTMRQGAADYITKPFEEERILLTVERTLNLSRIMVENKVLKQALNTAAEKDQIIYVSKPMTAIMEMASRVAESDSTAVLIVGESGTGKELLAKFIYRASIRKDSRFVPINCAAISPNLVESELFGHEKGAFTSADRRAIGKFEFASGGILFLDEIGDLPLEAQAKLLRALQEKKIQRVGGNEEVSVDVRVICATNRNLDELLEKGDFRQDLFFRINVFPIQVPPLRERAEDVIPLAKYFLSRFCGGSKVTLDEKATDTLLSYPWPGNIRELANAIERAAILSKEKDVITGESLSFLKNTSSDNNGNGFRLPPEGILLEDVEKEFVRQALEASGYNQSAASRLLGLTRAKFRVLMKQIKMTE